MGIAQLIAILSGILALLLALSVAPLWQKLGLGIFGVMVISVPGYERLRLLWSERRGRLLDRLVATLFADDKAKVLLADSDGRILYHNATVGRFDLSERPRMEQVLGRVLANPRTVQLRLQDKARQKVWAEETLVTRRKGLNLSARSV